MLYYQQYLPDKKPSMLDSKGDNLGNDIKEVLTLDKLHNEVDKVGVLNKFVEMDNKRAFWSDP